MSKIFGPCLAGLAVFLGLWGNSWCVPAPSRLTLVLPRDAESPAFLKTLEDSWKAMYEKFGPDLLLHPDSFTFGFDKTAAVEPGWKTPPPLLYNSARSYHLRTGHEDESDIIVALSHIRPDRLEFNPHIYFYGGAYMYSLGAWIGGLSLVTPAKLRPHVQFYLEHPDQLAWVYILGRMYSFAAFLAGAWLLFIIGRKFFNPAAGLIASAIWITSPGMVIQAHYMKPHLLGAVFLMAAFYFCAELLEDRRLGPERWIWAGVMIGLAAGSAVHMWSCSVLVAFTAWARWRLHPSTFASEAKNVAVAAAASLSAYFMTNPWMLAGRSLQATGRFQHWMHFDFNFIWQFVLIGMPKATTLPVLILLALGLATADNLKNPIRLLALELFFFYLLGILWILPGVLFLDSIRYFPVAFTIFLLAGVRIAELWEQVSSPLIKRAVAATAGLTIAYAGIASGVLDYNFYLDAVGRSTRDAAGQWIEKEIPAGSELGFLRLFQPSNAPYFQWNRYKLRFIEPLVIEDPAYSGNFPQYLVLTSPTYDDRPYLASVLAAHYEIIKEFKPAHLAWIRPPLGETYANPLVTIYRKRA